MGTKILHGMFTEQLRGKYSASFLALALSDVVFLSLLLTLLKKIPAQSYFRLSKNLFTMMKTANDVDEGHMQ